MMDKGKPQDELPELSRLAREAPTPPELEERVVQALRSQGLLRVRALPWRRRLAWMGAAAIAAAIFFAGVLVGNAGRPASSPEFHPTYALLLRTGPNYDETESGGQELQRVEEYRAWARGIAESGIGIRGEKLADTGQRLSQRASEQAVTEAEESERLGGFFLIDAPSLAEALRIAGSCPHLRHGGTIELRPIDPT